VSVGLPIPSDAFSLSASTARREALSSPIRARRILDAGPYGSRRFLFAAGGMRRQKRRGFPVARVRPCTPDTLAKLFLRRTCILNFPDVSRPGQLQLIRSCVFDAIGDYFMPEDACLIRMPEAEGAKRPSALGSLRIGAALALVLAAAGTAPAFAQASPDVIAAAAADDAANGAAPDDADRDGDRDGPRRLKPGEKADKVFVFGRKIQNSIATLPDPREAPQVVNVISAETMAEQGVTSLEQALRNVPGITTQIGEGGTMNGDQFFIRGFAAKDDIYTDGLRDFGVFTRDSFNYGQVEVLKGPSSTLLGRGTTGGGINTTTKTPFLDDSGSVTLAGGNAEYERATLDWNRKLGDSTAVRLNAMVHHNAVEGRDMVESDRWGVAPSIGFGLDDETTLTIAGLYQQDDRVPDYGIPTVTFPNGRIVPFSELGVRSENYYGYTSDKDRSEVYTVTARLRHQATDWLTLTSDTKFGSYTRYFQQTVPNGCTAACAANFLDNDPATIPLINIGGPGPYDQTTLGVQNISTASITAPIGGFRNEFIGGFDVSWQTNDRDQFNYLPARSPKNVLTPEHSPAPTLSPVKNNTRESSARDVSLFINDRFWFTPQWSVSAGLRSEWYEFDQNTTAFTATTGTPPAVASTTYTPLSANSQFTSPKLALIWEPSEKMSYYVSYATSSTPPGITVSNGSTINANTQDLKPEKNTSYEAGAKFELFKNVLVQASIFDVKKNNSKVFDDFGNPLASSGDSQEARGVELGIGGNITKLWGVNLTYAYTDAKTKESTTVANIGKQVQFVPKNAASLWSTYNFEGPLAGLQVGGGVTYQDRVFLNAANNSQAPSYISLDGLVSYAFDRYRISVNAYNLTDEFYYSQVNGNRVVPAPGRSFVATLGVAF
jgi:catecholate siderophore receptor